MFIIALVFVVLFSLSLIYLDYQIAELDTKLDITQKQIYEVVKIHNRLADKVKSIEFKLKSMQVNKTIKPVSTVKEKVVPIKISKKQS